jgi:hypothetical protein
MKSKTEEAALVAAGVQGNEPGRKIEEGRGEEGVIFHQPNAPSLFDDEKPAVAD